MSRFEFALAGPADDEELRRRMAEVWMEGDIAISFRREPSYFRGCRLQGEIAQVVKCTDLRDGRIVGMGSRLTTTVYVNATPLRVGYLADLRGRPEYRRGTLLARGFRYLHELHQSDPVPFYFTIIFDGNEAAFNSLLGGRAGLPRYSPMGRILTPAIHLDFARPGLTVEGATFQQATEDMLSEVVSFLRTEAARKQFSPVIALADFDRDGRCSGLTGRNFYIARSGGRIVACVAAWDQSNVRQTHIERYSVPWRAIRPFYNLASALSPLKPLPPAGARVPHLYLSCIAVRDNDVRLFRGLLRYAYNQLRIGPWHYAVAGLHEQDPLSAVLHEYRGIAAAGRLYLVHYPEDGDPRQVIDAHVPYVEMAFA